MSVTFTARGTDPNSNFMWPGDFPEVLVYNNDAMTQTLRIENDGVGPLNIASIDPPTGSEDFAWALSDYSPIASGEYRDIVISFLPT